LREGTPAAAAEGYGVSIVIRHRVVVRLFAEEVLIATRWTERGRPERYYAVDGSVYDVSNFLAVRETDGSQGFDVTLVARQ
jgi:hypothetical protein